MGGSLPAACPPQPAGRLASWECEVRREGRGGGWRGGEGEWKAHRQQPVPPQPAGRPAGWECEVGREGRGGEGEWEAHRQQPVPHSQPAVLLVGSVKWGGRGGEGQWEAHRQQPVPHSQPAVLLVVSVKWGARGEEGRGMGGSPPAACSPQPAGRPAGWECEVGREGRGGEGSGRLTASSLSPTASRPSCWLGV